MIKIFVLLAALLLRVFICSDTTEIECYEDVLFDFGSDAESLNLYEDVNLSESKSTYSPSSDSSSLHYHDVSITFNFENVENREEGSSILTNHNNRIFASGPDPINQDHLQDYITERIIVPSPAHTRNAPIFSNRRNVAMRPTHNSNYQNFIVGRVLTPPTTQARNNYRILTQNQLRHQHNNTDLNYRNHTTSDTLPILREWDTGVYFKTLFILLVISITLAATLH